MEINKTTFCASPWFQIRQIHNGSFKSCCAIDHSATKFKGQTEFHSPEEWLNSDYVRYLRKKLTTGVKLPECYKCWKLEENNLVSLRHHMNNTVTNNVTYESSWMSFYFKNKKDYINNEVLISADIATSHVCNFSCAMCSPEHSSKIFALWNKDQNHPLVKEYLDKNKNYLKNIKLIHKEGKSYTLLKELLLKTPRHIKFAGGEPLLDEYLLLILDRYQYKEKTSLVFVTNGSIDLTYINERFSNYKNISFIISLENIGNVQDYVRRGSIWSKIEQNIFTYTSKYSTKNLYVHTSLQALTIYHLPELISWTLKNNIRLGCGIVYNPKYLSFNAIPQKMFNKIFKKLTKNDVTVYREDGDITTEASMFDLINLIKKNYVFDQESFKKLKIFLDWYDPEQHWKHILPEWLDVFPD